MRVFIAIELDQDTKAALSSLEEKLKISQADVKWVEPENIHLTLKFLGERDEKKIKQIVSALTKTAQSFSSYSSSISTLGAFPNLRSARVIWAGIDKGDNETKTIAANLEEEISRIGIPKERRAFSSHITIGRVRSFKNIQNLYMQLEDLSKKLSTQRLEFNISELTLFKSTLSRQGAIYEAIARIPLKTT